MFKTYLLDTGLHQKLNMKLDFFTPESSAYFMWCVRTQMREAGLGTCVYVISFTLHTLDILSCILYRSHLLHWFLSCFWSSWWCLWNGFRGSLVLQITGLSVWFRWHTHLYAEAVLLFVISAFQSTFQSAPPRTDPWGTGRHRSAAVTSSFPSWNLKAAHSSA